jgi:hypothetical protein
VKWTDSFFGLAFDRKPVGRKIQAPAPRFA